MGDELTGWVETSSGPGINGGNIAPRGLSLASEIRWRAFVLCVNRGTNPTHNTGNVATVDWTDGSTTHMPCKGQLGGPVLKTSGWVQETPFGPGDKSNKDKSNPRFLSHLSPNKIKSMYLWRKMNMDYLRSRMKERVNLLSRIVGA